MIHDFNDNDVPGAAIAHDRVEEPPKGVQVFNVHVLQSMLVLQGARNPVSLAHLAEEVHCGIQALTRRGVAPMPEGREQSIAAHRAPGLLQGREDVFNRLEGRIGPGFRISRPGDSCGSRHGSHYMYPYSICILPPWMRN